MSEQIENCEVQNQETQVSDNEIQTDITPDPENMEDTAPAKPKFTKKKLAVFGGIAAAIIAAACVLNIPSEFERVSLDCGGMTTGWIEGNDDYFILDTLPDEYGDNAEMDEYVKTQMRSYVREETLEAIQYANEELGFNGSVYSQMMNTTALMGRQSAENDKYRVSWTYHPDNGLEVTYEKK